MCQKAQGHPERDASLLQGIRLHMMSDLEIPAHDGQFRDTTSSDCIFMDGRMKMSYPEGGYATQMFTPHTQGTVRM